MGMIFREQKYNFLSASMQAAESSTIIFTVRTKSVISKNSKSLWQIVSMIVREKCPLFSSAPPADQRSWFFVKIILFFVGTAGRSNSYTLLLLNKANKYVLKRIFGI